MTGGVAMNSVANGRVYARSPFRRLYVQAAAGVVADSVPELEWKETEAKARALLRASELVEEGLE